jgi:hypothetical protein
MTAIGSPRWRVTLLFVYALLALVDPLVRVWWRAYGLGNVVEIVIPGRRTMQPRATLVGLLTVGDRWYVGHPNGPVNWTRNLAASGRARIRLFGMAEVDVKASPLGFGSERDRAILATDQHPFPGNLVYRLARRHVRVAGVYFRLEPSALGEEPTAATSNPSVVNAGDAEQPIPERRHPSSAVTQHMSRESVDKQPLPLVVQPCLVVAGSLHPFRSRWPLR